MKNLTAKIKKQFRTQPNARRQRLNRGKRILKGHKSIVEDWPLRKELIFATLADFRKISRQMLKKIKRPFKVSELKREKSKIIRLKYLPWYHWIIWKARLKIAGLAILYGIGITIKTIVDFITELIRVIVEFFIAFISAIVNFVARFWISILLISFVLLLFFMMFKMASY